MAKRKRRKYTAKTKGRILIFLAFFGVVIATLCYTLFLNLTHINKLDTEKNKLKKEKLELKEKESASLADIKRLSDPLYIARYAREKYFYSKDGEIILRMDEKN